MKIISLAIIVVLFIILILLYWNSTKKKCKKVKPSIKLQYNQIELDKTPQLSIATYYDWNILREKHPDQVITKEIVDEIAMNYRQTLLDILHNDDGSDQYRADRMYILSLVYSFPYFYEYPDLYTLYFEIEERMLREELRNTIIRHEQEIVEPIAIRENRIPVEIDIYEDSQNVHDVFVVNKARDISNKITNITADVDIDEIRNAINKHLTGNDRKRAHESLNTMLRRNSTITSLSKNEIAVIRDVWNRQYEEGNNAEELQKSFVNALKDNCENGFVTCAVGCTTRLLDSLTYIDKDQAEPMVTLPVVRQEIFDTCGKLMQEYDDENQLKQKIEEVVDNYAQKFPHYNFNKIREECLGAI